MLVSISRVGWESKEASVDGLVPLRYATPPCSPN